MWHMDEWINRRLQYWVNYMKRIKTQGKILIANISPVTTCS